MISCYIPCYNHGKYLREVIDAVRAQTHPVHEIFVVDDASTDDSVEVAQGLEVRVVALKENKGRGYVRALAMNEARHELVLSCDATNAIPPDFVERALGFMEEGLVAGVCGLTVSQPGGGFCARWRDRNLVNVKELTSSGIKRDAALATGAALVWKAPVMQVGNYDARLRHYEDEDLGRRLRSAGHRVLFDPGLRILCLRQDNPLQLLERYARWYSGYGGPLSLADYKTAIYHSIQVMARKDLQEADPAGVIISLLCPHYQFVRSLLS